MGFQAGWWLPQGSRLGLRAVDNAVPPPLAQAVMACAKREAAQQVVKQPEPQQAPEPHEPAHEPDRPRRATDDELTGMRRKLRRLARRIRALEASGGGTSERV